MNPLVLMGIFLAVSLACAQDAFYLEGEDYLGGSVPGWAPGNSGRHGRGVWEGTSRGRCATLNEVPEPGVIAYHIGDGTLPPGDYHLWLRARAGDNNRSVAVAFGPFGDGEPGPVPAGVCPDPGDDGAFYWRQTARDGQPTVLTVTQGKDHALVLSRAGNDSPYVDVIAFVPAQSGFVPSDALPEQGYSPRIRPKIVAAHGPASPMPDPDLARFRMPQIPPADGEATVALQIEPTGAIYFPLATAGRFHLYLNLRVSAGTGLSLDPQTDRFDVRLRELFSSKEVTVVVPLAGPVPSGETRVLPAELSSDELPLNPGAWLVIADLVREGKSLCGGRVGAAEVYVRRPDESRAHALASFQVAHAGFNHDRLFGGHFVGMKALIPSTYDPLADETWPQWLKLYSGDTGKFLELLHDGGFGILHCAKVFRALGEVDRAEFAERIVTDDVLFILEKMVQEDGKVHCCHDELEQKWPELKAGHSTNTADILQNDGFVLKLACQLYFHCKDLPGGDALAERIMKRAAILARHVCDPKWLPCQGCSVYDGRTISGQAWWVLAAEDYTGVVPLPEAETVVRNCIAASTQAIISHGWYDRGCLVEGGCHVGYGAQNIINALQPGFRVAELINRSGDAGHMALALRSLYTFLVETNAVITGQPLWRPTRHSSWSNGHMYVLCSEYLRDFEENPRIRTYRDQIGANFLRDTTGNDGGISKWHGLDALATIIYSCPEYLEWEKLNGPVLY